MPSKINVASFTPRDNLILIEPDFAKNTSIIIPENVKAPLSPFGTVVAVGPGRLLENGERAHHGLFPGNRVQVHGWAGQPVEIKGRAMLCCDANYVIGIIEDLPPSNILPIGKGKQ